MPDVTNITPPRVPFIDERTGLIDRAWYMFFLSLFTSVRDLQDAEASPNLVSLLASYDAAIHALADEVGVLPAIQQAVKEDELSPSQPLWTVPDDLSQIALPQLVQDDLTPAVIAQVPEDDLTPAVTVWPVVTSIVAGDNITVSNAYGDVTINAISGLTVATVTGTTQTAVAGSHYVLTNVATTTLTLPASPASGDTVAVTVANAIATNVIARNGQTIMAVAADMTIDDPYATVTLRFLSSSWRII